jgi:AsmA protein
MNPLLKWSLIGIGALVALMAAAAAWLLLSFDPNSYKQQITQAVKDSKNRTLTIDGPIKLGLWPKLHVALNDVKLSERASNTQFLSAEALELSVALLPLFSGNAQVDKVAARGVTANYVRAKDGKRNIDDLLSQETSSSPSTVRFDVRDIALERVTLNIKDALAGTDATVKNLSMKSGRIADKTPTTLTLTADIDSRQPKAAVTLSVKGGLRFDLAQQLFEFSDATLALKGSGPFFENLDGTLQGDIAFDGKNDALNARDFKLAGKGKLLTQPARKKGAAMLDASRLDISATELAFSLGKQTLAAQKLRGEIAGRYNDEPLDMKLDAAQIAADLPAQKVAATQAKLEGNGTFSGTRLDSLNLSLPKLDFDGKSTRAQVQDIQLAARGKRGGNAFDASVAMPALAVTPESARGDQLRGKFKVEGQTPLEGTINSGAIGGTMKALTINGVRINGQGSQGDKQAKLDASADVLANLEALRFELPRLAVQLDAKDPSQAFKQLALNAQGKAAWDAKASRGNADLKGKLDDSNFTLAGTAQLGTAGGPTVVRADLTVDQLNADRYLPAKTAAPAASAAPAPAGKGTAAINATEVDLSFVEDVVVSGSLRAGQLIYDKKNFRDVRLEAKSERGRLTLPVISAKAYEGSIEGSAVIESTRGGAQRVALKQTMTNVNVQQALKDFSDKDMLEGRGNISLNVTGTGTTVGQIKKTLNGDGKVVLRDGAVKGINLAKSLREAKAALSLSRDQRIAASRSEKTDFSEMTATFTLVNGVMSMNDLKALSPFVRIGGEGKVDLGNDAMDYLVKATLVNTSKGQGGAEDLSQLKDLTIPVRLTGPLDNLSYDIQWSKVASAAVAAAAGTKIEDVKDKAKSKLEDKLRDKLGLPASKPATAAASAPASATAPAAEPAKTNKSAKDEIKDKAKEKLKGLFGR